MIRMTANALGLALMLAAGPADAAIFAFSGTRANVNVLNAPGTGRCAPLNTVNIAPGALSSSGTSNFGDFASTQNHCIPGPPNAMNPVRAVTDGIFEYAFAVGDSLFGTYSGTATFADGIVTGVENLIVTSGTGRFDGATGTITAIGTLGFAPNPGGPGSVGVFNGTVEGILDLPAVPEPATWGMMIGGFGMIGGTLRRRRQTSSMKLSRTRLAPAFSNSISSLLPSMAVTAP